MSRRFLALATGLGLLASPLALNPGPAQAQVDAEVSFARVRAVNLARDTAVKLNGGLTLYRPAKCMFDTSLAGGNCLIRRDNQGFLFRFLSLSLSLSNPFSIFLPQTHTDNDSFAIIFFCFGARARAESKGFLKK